MVTTKNYYHYARRSTGGRFVSEQYLTIMGEGVCSSKSRSVHSSLFSSSEAAAHRSKSSTVFELAEPMSLNMLNARVVLVWFGRTFRTVVSPRVRLWSTDFHQLALRSSSE
jgi:hypothetical protein